LTDKRQKEKGEKKSSTHTLAQPHQVASGSHHFLQSVQHLLRANARGVALQVAFERQILKSIFSLDRF
jgi:hypothetical protein